MYILGLRVPPAFELAHLAHLAPRGLREAATVGSRNLNSQLSNRGSIAYVRFDMPFECSNLPGAGPSFPA